MTQAERERRHRARLAQIEQVQVVCGRGDRARLDHEATLLERARLLAHELDAHRAIEQGLEAFDRLLRRAEEAPHQAAAREIAQLAEAVWNDLPLPLRVLRGLAPDVAADMVAVLDAYRHAQCNLAQQVAGGPRRVARVVAAARQPDAVRRV